MLRESTTSYEIIKNEKKWGNSIYYLMMKINLLNFMFKFSSWILKWKKRTCLYNDYW